MKKLVFFVFILLFTFLSFGALLPNEEELDQDYQVIPDDAIRLRILANSDDDQDQAIKNEVRDRVNEEISEWVEEIADINEARALIQERLPEVDELVREVLSEHGETKEYTVDYDKNVTFPMKLYGDYLYPPGEYEAILITIGEGKGSNWWCVLFPPLCFLDFSFGTSVEEQDTEMAADQGLEEEEEETEVKFFLFEWFGWS